MRRVAATVIVGATVFSLAPNVGAQSLVRNQQQDSSVVLSGASLRGIQSRSIEKDFPRGTAKTPIPSLRSNVTNQASGADALTGLLGNVGKRLEFGGVNDGAYSPRSNGRPLPSDVGNGEYDDGFKVRYRLNDK